MADIRHIRIAPNTTLDIKDDTKIPNTSIGAAGGVAQLDATGKVPSSQLPSYVDDVLEYADVESFPLTGETGKIYVALNNNRTYRWSGTTYVEISESLALGETSSTAYRGDRGKTAYDHASAKGSAFAAGMYKITTNSEGHVTAATAVAKSDITGLGIPAQDTTYSAATQSAAGLMSAADKTKLDGVATGATANVGTITGIKMNGTSKGTSGVVDLGTVITAHQNISGKADKVSSATAGDVATLDANGNLVDSGKTLGKSVPSNAVFTDTTYSDMTGATSSAAGAHGLVPAPASADRLKYLRGDGTWAEGSSVDISGKADKVSGATSGNVATLDANGNLVDSGKTLGVSVPSNAKFTDTTYSDATQSAEGLMSAADKTKLDGVATGATANVGTITGITMNGASKGTSGVVDLGTVITAHQDISGKVSGPSSATNNAVAIFDGTGGKTIKNSGFTIGKSVPSDAKFTDTTYSNATTSAAGLMSSTDKTKLDGVETGATKFTKSMSAPPNNTINDNTLFGCYFAKDDAVTGLPTNSGSYYYSMLLNGCDQTAIRYSSSGMTAYFVRYYINSQWYAWKQLMLSTETELGSQSSLANLNSAIATEVASMSSNEMKIIRFSNTSQFGLFTYTGGWNGYLFKTSTRWYAHVFTIGNNSGSSQERIGTGGSDGVIWKQAGYKEDLTWTLAGTKTGTDSISITSYNEILCDIKINDYYCYTIIIPKGAQGGYYRTGIDMSENVAILKSGDNYSLQSAYSGGNNYTSTTTVKYYKR